jgi:hypothetical protein
VVVELVVVGVVVVIDVVVTVVDVVVVVVLVVVVIVVVVVVLVVIEVVLVVSVVVVEAFGGTVVVVCDSHGAIVGIAVVLCPQSIPAVQSSSERLSGAVSLLGSGVPWAPVVGSCLP